MKHDRTFLGLLLGLLLFWQAGCATWENGSSVSVVNSQKKLVTAGNSKTTPK